MTKNKEEKGNREREGERIKLTEKGIEEKAETNLREMVDQQENAEKEEGRGKRNQEMPINGAWGLEAEAEEREEKGKPKALLVAGRNDE